MFGLIFRKIETKYPNRMRKILFLTVIAVTFSGCFDKKKQAESILRHYIDRKVDLIRNYTMETEVALWNATVSGNESDYKKLIDIELNFNKSNRNTPGHFAPDRFYTVTQNVFANQEDFELLRKLKYSGLITDTLLVRQLNVLYQAFMGSQIESGKYKELMMREVKLWQAFSASKVEIDGKVYGSGQIDSVRRFSTDDLLVQKISESIQETAKLIAPDIVRMVKDRNEIAVGFGYPDFYHLTLEAKDQVPERVKLLLEEMELRTRDQFFEAKMVIDKMLAKRFGIPAAKLRPWHYNDERTSYLPQNFTHKLDSMLSPANPIHRTSGFFESIGFPIQDVIDNSKLDDVPETAHLTAMINVDFKNDIRLIAGITNTHDGLIRMMHLGGHASHYKSISDEVPYLLKTPNSVVGEGIARYFEYMGSDYRWLKNEISDDGTMQEKVMLVCQHLREVDRLLRCRKLLAFAEFEREIYRNPEQDLDLLWHKLSEKYLGLNCPSEKGTSLWATNKFATSLSCTVHNFVLADIFAAQVQHTIEKRVLKNADEIIRDNKAVGEYLTNNLYRYGNLLSWEKLIEKATGEPLNPVYFVKQLIGEENNGN
jgi:peptidyl-dipeptidase A